MAVTGSGRGPIKVGSGYIDVFPKLNQKQLKETRAQLEKQMGATGKAAGKTFVNGLTEQVATVPRKAKAAAEKAQKEIQKSAMDSRKVLKRIEQEITKEYGKAAGKRFKEAAELEKKKQKLLEQTSAATRKAIQNTVREEEKAEKTKAKAWQAAEKERLKLIRDRERAERQAQAEELRRQERYQQAYMRFLRDRRLAAEKAARDEARANRRAHQQMRDDIRRTLMESRAARLADLRSQMDAQRDQLAGLRNQLRTYRRQMDDHTRSVGRGLTGLATSWRRQGEAIERLGTNVTETGRLVSMNLLAPLGAVAGMLTTIGVKSADMRILGQMGLSAAGVSKKESANQMNRVQQYAIDTPFSIDTMHEYQMKIIRSLAGADDTWYKKKTKTKAANRAASKTTDILMAVGDTMARAGNLDPEMFKRAMYAVDRMLDMNKAPTRSINQLVQASGISASELANMFGFKSSGEFWKVVGTPVNKGGGIKGQDMVNNLLRYWDPNYFELDKNGKPKIDPKTKLPIVNQDSKRKGGSAGYGEKMTTATISGRISQIKERAQFELGSLFAKENKKTGEYEYTGLGEMLMGKKVVQPDRIMGLDKNGRKAMVDNPRAGEVSYEGGLLQQVQELMGGQKDNVISLIKTSLSALKTFVEQIQWFSDWLNAHPHIKEVFANLLKMAAVALPFIIAIGLVTKVFGKVAKIFGSAMAPIRGAARAVQGGSRVARQNIAGNEAERNTRRRLEEEQRARRAQTGNRGTLRQRIRESRDIDRQVREAGNQAYRDRRTQLRGGDTRGPGARLRDRVTGRDSGASRLRTSMRDTEDAIRETEDAIRQLQRQIRDTNSINVNELVNRFAGRGNNTLQGAANNAGSQVNNVTTQVGELNRAGLGTIGGEVNNLEEKVKNLKQQVENTVKEFGNLNDKNLTSLKVSVDSAHGTVGDLKDKLDNAILAVKDLDKKNLTSFKVSVDSAHGAVGDLKDKVDNTALAVSALNRKKLESLSEQFHKAMNAADDLKDKIKETIKQVGNLNDAKISTIRGAFHGAKVSLYNAVNDVYKLVGTSKSGLHGRLVNMDNRSLKKIIEAVNDLAGALKGAGDRAGELETSLDNISKKAPGNGGPNPSSKGGSKKGKNHKPPSSHSATGGVLPGYTPGRDVHVFTSPTLGDLHLSGGEAVMRPEFTAALGEHEVNRLNLLARTKGIQGVRNEMRFARGGKIDLDEIRKYLDLSIAPEGISALKTMRMDSSSDRIGGSTRQGILGTGDGSSRFLGGSAGTKFRGAYDWMTDDLWVGLKKLPTVVGQIAGTLVGAFSPVQGEYFWNDVWKGNGNIIDRGKDYLADLFSTKTLSKVWENLSGGVFDSLSSLYHTAKGMLTDPIGYVSDTVGGVFDLVKDSYNDLVSMVDVVKEIKDTPLAYGQRVFDNFMSTAKENMPNTKGLFDFNHGEKVNSKAPDMDAAMAGISGGGKGSGANRWKGTALQAMSMLGLPPSALGTVLHRINLESGGNPTIVNKWDSNWKAGHPSVGLMQVIGPTFDAYAGLFRGMGPKLYGTSVNPLANIYAGLNYAKHRYGARWQQVLAGNTGYASGTLSASPGLAVVGERGREIVDFGRGGARVYSNQETESMLAPDTRPIYITVNEAKSENTTDAVIRAFGYLDTMYGNR